MSRIVVLALLTVGCAAPLPPHVWLPVQNLESVDFFWWTDQQVCQERIVYWDRGEAKGITLTVDASACRLQAKQAGFKVP